MSGFEPIKNQEQPIGLLSKLLQRNVLPHALLFTGVEGIGKRTVAMAFAMACNCLENDSGQFQPYRNALDHGQTGVATAVPCRVCKSCRKIESGNHPDIIFIKPTGPFIRIAQIRELCHTLSLKPYEAGVRVVMITDAQTMNPESGNALLKVLEEPPDKTLLILTASQTADLLPTIVSRCQCIRFHPISRQALENLLTEQHGIETGEAEMISLLANGSISKALSMKGGNWIRRRNWLINEVGSLASGSIGALLAFAEALSKNKATLSDSLDILQSWFRDLVIWKVDPGKIINRDLTDKIQDLSQKSNLSLSLWHIDTIRAAKKEIQGNANVRLSLEKMAIKLARTEMK